MTEEKEPNALSRKQERRKKTIGHRDVFLSSKHMASVLSMSERNLSALVTQGILIKEEYGIYALMPNVANYVAFLRRNRPQEKHVASYERERTRLTSARADITENELALQSGSLLLRDNIARAWDMVLELVRSRFITLADRVAPRVLDAEQNLEVIREIIREESSSTLLEVMNTEMKYESELESVDTTVINRARFDEEGADSAA